MSSSRADTRERRHGTKAHAPTVGTHIVGRLRDHGVRRVYGYPGDGINGILGGFHELGDEIEFVQAAHEVARRPSSRR